MTATIMIVNRYNAILMMRLITRNIKNSKNCYKAIQDWKYSMNTSKTQKHPGDK
jgi:hypothetical protein